MRKKITTASAALASLLLLLTNSSWAVIFMPKGPVDDFLERLPSELSQEVNQEVDRQAKAVLLHQPPERSEKGKDLLLEAKVRNKPPQAMVVIHYRHQQGKPFFTREMETADDSIFTYKLPGYLLSEENVEYYLEVISATRVHAQSGTYFQPHRVDLFSRTGGLKYLLWGLVLVGGVFMLFRMGSRRKRTPPRQAPNSPNGTTRAKLARGKLSAKVRR